MLLAISTVEILSKSKDNTNVFSSFTKNKGLQNHYPDWVRLAVITSYFIDLN